MCWSRARRNLEESFPHHNMVLVLLFQFVASSAYAILTPSLYKFITTPTTRPDELNCAENGTRFWPGLGRSDSDYALVLMSYPLFEVATTPLAGALLHRLPYSFTIIVFIIVDIAGGVVYGLARSLWVAFVGFGLFGMGSALASVTVHTYMGEMGTVMDDIRKKQGKKPRKYILYVAFSFVVNGGFLPALAMNSIIAQFDVNPYHWPGWAHASLSASVGLLTLLFFVETRSLSQAKPSCTRVVSCLTGIKLEAQLQTKCSKLAPYMFLCGCGFLGGMMYTIVSALVPPVLSDQFGFNVEYTSHYLLVMSSAYLISSFLQLAAKCARTDNRKILGLGIVFAMAGSVLFGDWQAVHSDPCLTSNSTADYFPTLNASGDNPTDTLCLGDSVTNSSYLQELVQSCESHGSSSNECFWNRQSRVTRTYCYTCLGVCLSLQRSQNIYQLSVAIMLLSISAGFLFVFSSAIVSDVASVKSQVIRHLRH
jgi:MFS family permease